MSAYYQVITVTAGLLGGKMLSKGNNNEDIEVRGVFLSESRAEWLSCLADFLCFSAPSYKSRQ